MLFVSPSALSSSFLAPSLATCGGPLGVPSLFFDDLLLFALAPLPRLRPLPTLESSLGDNDEKNLSRVRCDCESLPSLDWGEESSAFSSLVGTDDDDDAARNIPMEVLIALWMGAAQLGVESTLSLPLGAFFLPPSPASSLLSSSFPTSPSTSDVSSLYMSPNIESSSSWLAAVDDPALTPRLPILVLLWPLPSNSNVNAPCCLLLPPDSLSESKS
mmetsp:Transcript_5068/g.12713  ORF Transcript_5068/g.12713 Transcript_5068/m.12713 type:complete len:216 (+) Transcript_5068:365-1012(+)